MKLKIESELLDLLLRLIDAIESKQKVKFAYLFGSSARAEESGQSDIDIALMFEDILSDIDDAFLRGELIDLGRSITKKEIDIVSLEKASTFLKYQIVKEGIVIKDDDKRITFESLAMREYFDFKYYSDIYDEAMINRLKNSGIR